MKNPDLDLPRGTRNPSQDLESVFGFTERSTPLDVNHGCYDKKSTTWIEINQLQPTEVTSQFEPAEESLFPERSVRVLREAKNVSVCGIFDLRSDVRPNLH